MSSIISRATVWSPLFDPPSEQEQGNSLIAESILTNKDIYTSIQSQHINGLNKQIRMLDRYANSGDYYYGSPVSNRFGGNTDSQALVDILDVIAGEPTGLFDSDYQERDADFFAREILIRDHGLVVTYYTSNLIKIITTDYIVPTPPIPTVAGDVVRYVSATFISAGLEITFEVTHADTSTTIVEYIDTSLLPDGNDFMHVIYHTVSVPNTLYYWTYDPSTNVYPELTGTTELASQSEWLPMVPMRVNRHDVVPEDGKVYDDVNHALDLVGLDYETIIEGVKENPDADIVEDVTLMFAVDITVDEPSINDYMYAHFSGYLAYNFDLYTSSSVPSGTYKSAGLVEKFTEVNFNGSFYTEFVEERTIVGTFTKDKEILSGGGAYNYLTYTTDPEGKYGGKIVNSNSIIYLRKKLTNDTYTELVIMGCNIYIAPYEDYPGFGRDKPWYARVHEYEGEPVNVMLPINTGVVRDRLRNPQTQKLVYRQSMVLLIAAREKTELEWYEEPYFAAFVIVVAVFISAATLQPEIATIATAATLLAAGELVLYLVINTYILSQITKYALEFLIDEFGLEDTFLAVAIIILVAVASQQFDVLVPLASSLATDFLGMSLVILNAFMEPIDDSLKAIESEYTDFLLSAEERQEEINEASDLLGDGSIDPLSIAILAPPILINETPSDFFNRTIHTGNIGVKSLDVIEDYVGNSLKLPETNMFI